MREIDLELRGLGVILYSPPAVAHIPDGSDYLREHFWEPDDVARHVMDCQLTAFCTGSPGSYRLRFFDGRPDESVVQAVAFKLRLGLQVVGGAICVRDLYDLMQWSAECPPEQQIAIPDGWYRLTVVSSPPPAGLPETVRSSTSAWNGSMTSRRCGGRGFRRCADEALAAILGLERSIGSG